MRMRVRLLAVFTLPLVLAFSAVADLRSDVDQLIRRADLGGATVGVSIVEAGSGMSLVDYNADHPMIPASNMKLLTTGAALHVLGPDFRFRTRLLLDGDRLTVVGDGDPSFGDPELLKLMTAPPAPGSGRMEDGRPHTPIPLDVESFLDLWVQPMRDAGVRTINELVVDDRVFDREFVHPLWPRKQLNLRYCAEVGGLSFHLNVLHFFPRPTAGGSRPALTDDRGQPLCMPKANWLRISNNATVNRGTGDHNTAWVARKFGTNELTFYGNVRTAYQTPVPVTIHDPPQFFGMLLADRMRRAGISVNQVRTAFPEDDPPRGTDAVPVVYTPIGTAITRCNRDSQNLYAESLLKRIGFAMTGQPGSWLNGSAILRSVVSERTGDSEGVSRLIVSDGSGLSRENRVPPLLFTAWLNSFHNDIRLSEPFLNSLAIGGETGTLENRLGTIALHGVTVHAKSGFINNVSCLTGYVTAPDGRRRCFSVMVNDLRTSTSKAKALQDAIVAAIAEDLAVETVQLGSD